MGVRQRLWRRRTLLLQGLILPLAEREINDHVIIADSQITNNYRLYFTGATIDNVLVTLPAVLV